MSDLSITKYFPFMRVKITKQTVHHEDASSAMIKFEPDRRYLLLKNENNLNQYQQDHLKKVLELNSTLNTCMY